MATTETPVTPEVQAAFDAATRAPLAVTRDQAAEIIGVSIPTIDRLTRTGELKTIKIGRSVRVLYGSLVDLTVRGAADTGNTGPGES